MTLLKFLVCCFVIANVFYFALRYHELLLTVKQLEAENYALSNSLEKGKEVNQAVIKEYEKKEAAVIAGEPILEYSQKKYYPLIHNEPNKCNDNQSKPIPIFLLIVIKSTTSQFDRRNAIRKTWGNETSVDGVSMRRIFLLARSNDEKKELLLAEEVAEYHDIIQGDFQDSFRNLTIKDIMFLRWMKTYCSQVKFIFKGDDDVFVNMQNIIDYVVSFPNDKAKDIFTGSVLYPSPRITDPKSKYYVSSNLWNEKYYPPYVSGGGFVMSSVVAKKIFEAMKILPIIPIDDAFLGVCLKKLGMKPQNHKGFKSWGVNQPRSRDVCVYREIMTLHKLNSEEMVFMWRKLRESNLKTDDCATVFQISNNNITKDATNR